MEQSISEKIKPGATIRVYEKTKKGEKTRANVFEGIVIARKHGSEAGATFTVRRVSQGVGLEKIFPLHSPNIEKVEILRSSRVRRAKLYYLRRESEKVARKKLRKERTKIGIPEKKIETTEEKTEITAEEKIKEDSLK